jgi:hypothetical protein
MVHRGGDHTATHNEVVSTIRQYLVWHKAYELKVLGGLGQRAGIPDVLSCLLGRFIAVEVKTGLAELTEQQEAECAKIAAAGGIVIVAHSVDDVEARLLAEGLVEPSLM